MENRNKNILLILAAAFACFLMWYFRTVFIYIAIASILSLIGHPLVKFFCKIKIGKQYVSPGVSAFTTLIILLLIFTAVIAIFIPLIITEAKVLASIDPHAVIVSFQEPLQKIEHFLNHFRSEPNFSFQTYFSEKLASFLNYGQLSQLLNKIAGITGNFFIAVFSIAFVTFFLLKDEKFFYNIILLLAPSKYEEDVKAILGETKILLTRYFIGMSLDVTLVIVCMSIGLSIVGVNNALIIAFFAGIVNIIPYIGPIIGACFGIIIGISTHLNADFYTVIFPLIGKIALVFLIVQTLDPMVFQPLIYANTVKAHPLEIFLVVLLSAHVAGIAGMILAIPVYTIVRIIAKQFLHQFRIIQMLTDKLDEK